MQLEPHRGHVVLPLTRQDIQDIFWLQATMAKELAATASQNITDAEIDDLERITDCAGHRRRRRGHRGDRGDGVRVSPGLRQSRHRAGNPKLAWFLLHVARYMPLTVYAADPQWGAAAVKNHRKLIAALRRRDTAAVVEHTHWQFTDGARRLTKTLDQSGIWG